MDAGHLLWDIGSGIGRIVSPPTILLLLTGVGLWHRRKTWGLRLAWTSLALLWALSLPIVADTLMDALTYAAVPVAIDRLPKERAMIVVLPGGKVNAQEYPRGEVASALTAQRARYAVWLAKASGLPLAIPGGKHEGVAPESELTRDFIENELHHPVALTEKTSLDTRQNALYLVEPLRKRNIDTVVLVTDARHMPRAAAAFAAAGFNVIRAPMAINRGEEPVRLGALIPSAQALVVSYDVSHEVIGRMWYAVRSLASNAH